MDTFLRLEGKKMFRNLIGSYDVFIFDLFGTLYGSSFLHQIARNTLIHLKNQKKKIVFLSNMPRPSKIAQNLLLAHQFDLSDIGIYTSGDHFLHDLQELNKNNAGFFQLGMDKNEDLLKAANISLTLQRLEKADFIILTAYTELHQEKEEAYIKECLDVARIRNVPVFCINPDHFALSDIHLNVIRKTAGYFAHQHQEKGGKVVYYGKPMKSTYDWMLAYLEKEGFSNRSKMLMVGDNLDTDIQGGQMAGLDTLLVLSGISKESDIKASQYKPTHVFQDVSF